MTMEMAGEQNAEKSTSNLERRWTNTAHLADPTKLLQACREWGRYQAGLNTDFSMFTDFQHQYHWRQGWIKGLNQGSGLWLILCWLERSQGAQTFGQAWLWGACGYFWVKETPESVDWVKPTVPHNVGGSPPSPEAWTEQKDRPSWGRENASWLPLNWDMFFPSFHGTQMRTAALLGFFWKNRLCAEVFR